MHSGHILDKIYSFKKYLKEFRDLLTLIKLILRIIIVLSFFLTAISHGQLLAILEGTASLNRCWSLRFSTSSTRRSLVTRFGP